MNRIKELRNKFGKSQSALAFDLHIAQNTISQWENENRDIDSAKLHVLADYFDVSVDYLLGRTDILAPLTSQKPAQEGELYIPDVTMTSETNVSLTYPEREHIKKYRALDERGKDTVETILDLEYSRVNPLYVIKAAKSTTDKPPTYIELTPEQKRRLLEAPTVERDEDL